MGRTRREIVLDASLVLVCVLVLVVLRLSTGRAGPELPTWWHVLGGTLVLAVAVVVGRRWPLAALVLVVPLAAVSRWGLLAVFLMAYLAGRRAPAPRPALGVLAGLAAAGVVVLAVVGAPAAAWLDVAWGGAVCVVFPWFAGLCVRLYRELTTAGWTRAEQLEREQRMLAEQVRLRERARIAEDMHDALGHELSLIALRAGALELAPDLSAARRDDAQALRQAAGAATEQLREVLGVLRLDADPPLQDTPVADLVAKARAAGVDVVLAEEGDAAAVPAKVERAVRRVVQEALTNATRHAAGAPVTVRVQYGADETRVAVRNGAGAATGAGSGSGLIGLRERVRLVGGTFTAAPDEDGAFLVTALLPHGAAALPEPDERSESARHREAGRRRLRRTVAAAVALPGLLGGAVLLGAYLVALDDARATVLSGAQLAALRVGQSRAEAAPALPPTEITGRGFVEDRPPPPGTSCAFYRSTATPFGFGSGVHRLCFRDDALVSIDLLPQGGAG